MVEKPEKSFFRSGCCLGCIVVLCLASLVVVFLYISIWRVPDPEPGAEDIIKRVEERLRRESVTPPEQNAWTYYKRAMDRLDLSVLQPVVGTGSPSPQSFANNEFTRITNLVNKGITKKDLPVLKDLIDANLEITKEVDKGFSCNVFYTPYSPINTAYSAPQYNMKAPLLGYYLILIGDYEKLKGRFMNSACLYLQSFYLGESLEKNNTNTYFLAGIYSHTALLRLRDVISTTNDLKLCDYVAKNLGRIQQPTFEEVLENNLYFLEQFMDQVLSPPAGKVQGPPPYMVSPLKIVIMREKKIARKYTLNSIKLYRQDPYGFISKVKTIQPAKYSFYGAMFDFMWSQVYQKFQTRQAIYNGLRTLIALKKFYLENGKYPENLSQLVPQFIEKLPTDPFSKDGNFKYENKDGNVYLYSFGTDGVDDYCKKEISFSNQNGDIVLLKIEKANE